MPRLKTLPKPMPLASKYTPEQWAEARRLRAEGLSFARIAKQAGFATAASISGRASREGWPSGTAAASSAPRKPGVRAVSPATVRIRQGLASRLYKIIGLEIRTTELRMKKQLDAYEQSPAGTEPPAVTKEERESFAALVESINLVTEMASEPALAADGRKFATINPELNALSDEIDADALAAASAKDDLRREIADELEKLVPPS
jgi:hypothetical protein